MNREEFLTSYINKDIFLSLKKDEGHMFRVKLMWADEITIGVKNQKGNIILYGLSSVESIEKTE